MATVNNTGYSVKTKEQNRQTWAAASVAWKERQEAARKARHSILVVHPMVTHWPTPQNALQRGYGVLSHYAGMPEGCPCFYSG